MLKGKKVILRPVDIERDLERCLAWINDPEVVQFLGKPLKPITRGKERELLEKILNDESSVVFAIDTFDGRHIGMTGLHRILHFDGTAVTGTMIGDKRFWGRGYGTDAKMLLLWYAFRVLNLRRVNSHVIRFNKRSLGCQLKCGYNIEGVKKGRFIKTAGITTWLCLPYSAADGLSCGKNTKKRAGEPLFYFCLRCAKLEAMDFRKKRQLAIIAAVSAAIFIPVAILAYIYAPRPTCFDNRKNQGEEEVDCGAICIPCALKHPEELSVLWVRFVKIRENTYDVVAEIRNPNLKLGAIQFEYEFQLLDTAGVQVARKTGRSFIFPGETAHLIETSMQTQRTLERATIALRGASWVFTDVIPQDVVVGEKRLDFIPAKDETTLTATLINRSLFDFGQVFLSALIFDERGNILAASKVTEKNLRSGETRPIFFSWPREIDRGKTTVAIESRVNTIGQRQ